MTTLTEPEVIGHQRPRIASVPYACSQAAGEDATELAAAAGLHLDDWQGWALKQAMGTREDGRWAAFEVGMLISRQNGKNGILLARQLAGLVLLGEGLIIHTAHEFKAAAEHFRKMRQLFDENAWLMRKVKPNGIRTSHGDEAIEMRPTPTLIFGARGVQVRKSVAPRLRFLARSRGSGRSFTCDCLVYDEAMILSDEDVGASMPTMSAVANPQMWYTASAGMQDSVQLNRVRQRGIAGTDDSLVWLEWSIEPHNEFCRPDCTEHDNTDDPAAWAKANPALGIRLSVEHVRREFIKMGRTQFERERLGVGDWPADILGWQVIPEDVWNKCAWREPGEPPRPTRFAVAVDVTPDQSASSIVVAGLLPDGRILIERGKDALGLDDHRPGVSWVAPRLRELKEKYGRRICAMVIDPSSPASVLLTELEQDGWDRPPRTPASTHPKLGLEIVKPATRDVGQAFGQFYSWIGEGKILHLSQEDINFAVAGGTRREIGDGQFAWSRKATTIDISPLCAATLAAWAAGKYGRGYNLLKSIG